MKAIDKSEALQALATAHGHAQELLLLALENAAAVLAEEEAARPFQQRMAFLREHLALDPRPAAVEENGCDASKEFERFVRECAHERERKAWECKQIIRTLSEAAAAIAQSGNTQSDVLSGLAARISAISRLDTMTEVRAQLAIRVDEIKALSSQMDQRAQRLASAVEAKMHRAEERLRAAHRLAETDALTGIGNRRMAENAIEAAITAGTPLSLILCDLDDFKTVNDTHGHQAGDQVLKAVAEAVKNAVRSGDVVCRWGGDEFVILILDQTVETVENIGHAVQRDVFGKFPVTRDGEEFEVEVAASVGTATYRAGEAAFDFFERADRMMYEKKLARHATPLENPASEVKPASSDSFARQRGEHAASGIHAVDRRRPHAGSGAAGIGSFIVHNHTSLPLRIEVGGRTYSATPGVFVIRLPVGQYVAKVVSRYGTSRVDLKISDGSAHASHFSEPQA